MPPVEIQIPPQPEFVGVVRLALGALGRSEGIEEEALEDLRIAVSETCANAVVWSEEAGSQEPICVGWTPTADRVVVDISDSVPGAPSASRGGGDLIPSRLELSMSLLRSLVDDLSLDEPDAGGHRTTLTIRKRAGSTP